MRLRAVFTIVVALVSLPHVAFAAERWRATVAPPRAGLPSVEIELGYPGLYVPAVNAPAEFRARAGDRPFDGYIGYHIAVGGHKATETPVIARAVLRPHSQGTFTTSMQLVLGMAAWMESYFDRR